MSVGDISTPRWLFSQILLMRSVKMSWMYKWIFDFFSRITPNSFSFKWTTTQWCLIQSPPPSVGNDVEWCLFKTSKFCFDMVSMWVSSIPFATRMCSSFVRCGKSKWWIFLTHWYFYFQSHICVKQLSSCSFVGCFFQCNSVVTQNNGLFEFSFSVQLASANTIICCKL